MVGTKSLPVQ